MMRIWQLEQNKDIQIRGPSCTGLVDPSGRAGENSKIYKVVNSSESILLLKCKFKENVQNFRIEGLSSIGKKLIELLKNDYGLIGKTITDLRNMEIET